MLVAAVTRGGGPEVMAVQHLPVPALRPGEVLVRVHAAGVAVWDAWERDHTTAATHLPEILGSDGSGVVAAVAKDVHDFKVGDSVYGASDGLATGFYAQYVAIPAADIAHIPQGVSLDEAGVLAVSGLSALQGIDDVLQLKAGDTLLIHGASGAVGTIAVQLAKARGIRVLATVRNAAGAALVRRLGADAVVNDQNEDIIAAAKRFAPHGVDAVLGLVGGDSLERCIDTLRTDRRGRVAYLEGIEGVIKGSYLPRPRLGVRMTLYSYIPGRAEFKRLNAAVEAAHLQVPIAAEYPLTDIVQAHRRLAAGHLAGKILLLAQK